MHGASYIYQGLGPLLNFTLVDNPDLVAVWWLQARKAVAKPLRKGFDTFVWLVAWST
jgi:hypothetical protein